MSYEFCSLSKLERNYYAILYFAVMLCMCRSDLISSALWGVDGTVVSVVAYRLCDCNFTLAEVFPKKSH
jgi:hypothetical protein